MELIGIPVCACTHNLPTQTLKFFFDYAYIVAAPLVQVYVFYVTLEYF